MKYNIGDKVLIAPFEETKVYRIYFNPLMERFCGKAFTITGIDATADGIGIYRIKETDYNGLIWGWSEEMIDGLATKPYNGNSNVFKR